MKKVIILFFIIFLNTPLFAESIRLNSGKIITGDIAEEENDHIKINDGKQVWKIKRQDIASYSAGEDEIIEKEIDIEAALKDHVALHFTLTSFNERGEEVRSYVFEHFCLFEIEKPEKYRGKQFYIDGIQDFEFLNGLELTESNVYIFSVSNFQEIPSDGGEAFLGGKFHYLLGPQTEGRKLDGMGTNVYVGDIQKGSFLKSQK